MKSISLNIQIFLGALMGVIWGMILGHSSWALGSSSALLEGFGLVGKIFIGLLKMIVMPLIFISITAGIANLKNSPSSRRVWPVLIFYSLTTTTLAAVTGLLIMNFVKAGVGLDIRLFKQDMSSFQSHSLTLHDFAHNLIDRMFMNPVTAMDQNNILGLVVFAILLGASLVVLGEKSQPVLKFINGLFEALMVIVRWIMRLAPWGIMGLLAQLVAQANIHLFYVLAKYILVVVGATLFHGLVTLPLILWLATRIRPWRFFSSMKEAFVTAFSTSSSTATLPVSIRCVTENLKVDPSIARFVLPVGATLNMDGTAMYEAMAALFVANLCGVHLSLLSQIVVVLAAMTASIGAPGIPSAGMVTMIMVLQSVGLPPQAVAILIPIDRPLDTIRTVVNVEGDCIGACVVSSLQR